MVTIDNVEAVAEVVDMDFRGWRAVFDMDLRDWRAIVFFGVGTIGVGFGVRYWLPLSRKRERAKFKRAGNYLRTYRQHLAHCALQGYSQQVGPECIRDGIPLIFGEGWLQPAPIPLSQLRITYYNENYSAPGLASRARRLLPKEAESELGFASYAEAIKQIEKPALFWNGFSYRLSNVESSGETPHLYFGRGHYFEFLDTCEILAYEAAKYSLRKRKGRKPNSKVHIVDAKLPVRKAVGDPFNLAGRCAATGINVLTLIADEDGSASFIMHHREGTKVASAMNTHHVTPAGEFQPSNQDPTSIKPDFSIWKTIMREFAEELVGHKDARGRGGARPDYKGSEPYKSLEAGLQQGSLRVWYLGIGLDPLSLKAEVLCVAVFARSLFDSCFRDSLVESNEEGLIFAERGNGIPFVEENIAAYTSSSEAEQTLSAGVACLRLAFRHREQLLAHSPPSHHYN